MSLRKIVPFAILLLAPVLGRASDAQTAIKKVLDAQVQAWNRGDIETFVTYYAEDCTFVGKQMVHGRSAVLARYRTGFPSVAAMGKLSFLELDVRPVDQQVALVTGKFHLDRAAEAGGPADGIFSLVMQLKNGNWQILLDHTS